MVEIHPILFYNEEVENVNMNTLNSPVIIISLIVTALVILSIVAVLIWYSRVKKKDKENTLDKTESKLKP